MSIIRKVGEVNTSPSQPKANSMSLTDRILMIDQVQARRFSRLKGKPLEIATEGIIRHLRACSKMDITPDHSAIREIIDDAQNERSVFSEPAAIGSKRK